MALFQIINLKTFNSKFVLFIASVISIILSLTISESLTEDLIDGISIIVAIIIVVLVSSITEYKKELKFQELSKTSKEGTTYKVIRNGLLEHIISDDILVGDLILINYGDIMCADIILVTGHGVKMDESALTGRSDPMKKMPYNFCLEENNKNQDKEKVPSPLILSGTNCIEGSGKGIVIAVGEYSQKGIIRRTVDNAKENNQTPLEMKLDKIGKMIGYFGICIGIVTFVIFFIRYMVEYSNDLKEYKEAKKNGNINNLENPKHEWAINLLNIIIICISIIVLAVPEGLPLTVTLSLAFSVKKLMEKNNLVRKMHACETMGGANYICTDKTGTLTKNEMSVHQILTGKNVIELNQSLDNAKTLTEEEIKENQKRLIREEHSIYFKNENFWELIKLSIALNIDCVINTLDKPDINGDIETCETKSKTEQVFIDFLYRFKSPISIERNIYLSNEECYKQIPFASKKKRMTTLIKNSDFPTGYRLFSKGTSEYATQICSSYIDPDTGEVENMNDLIVAQIKDKIEEFNKNKLRTLYLAYKDITENDFNNYEQINSEGKSLDQYDMVFLGIFGIRDSLRDNVKDSVEKCKIASVKVIMVTGDDIITSTALAKECGILDNDIGENDNDIEKSPEQMNNIDTIKKENYIKKLIRDCPYVLTGNSFFNIIGGLICENCKKNSEMCKCPKTEAEAKQLAEIKNTEIKGIKKDKIKDLNNFSKIIKNLKVLVRSQPIHKYALVLGLKTLNNIVGVTGDGTNDAPALSKSDVGFAMFSGTDIAKEASDIIILDNNFTSIITAIIYGRNIYDNIRKFLQFQLSVNFCACLIVFICACIGNETPLTPIQMLWVNLIMDSLGSLALATEPPYDELLKRDPTKRNESIINGRMWKHIIIQSLIQIVILLILYLIAPEFIEEGDLVRKAENTIIKYCYGKLPGDGEVDHIIYGTESKWSADTKLLSNINKVYCGGYASRQSLSVAYKEYSNDNDGSVHMTLIFNVFVIYTLFNQINCRMIDDSFNIFKRMQKSLLFPLITICELGLQVIIVIFGKNIFHVANRGLTGEQWGICFGFSAITFVVSIIVKLIPLEGPIDNLLKKEDEKPEFKKKKTIKETEHSTNDSSDEPKKMYDQALPVETRREREERDILKLSENSSTFVKKENEEF